MPTPIKIDFVSDVSCPWCVIGLGGLETAIGRVGDLVDVDIHFQPFELNPQMAPEGENIVEHIGRKYGSTPEQSAQARAMIKGRAAEVGFAMRMTDESRIYNTFDAHRLLHWAEGKGEGRQAALKAALFEAYFTKQLNPGDPGVLADAAASAGLDRAEAVEVLSDDLYAADVHAAEELWRSRGINSVPAVIINDKYLISGGQPAEVFEQALRQIAAEGAAPSAV
ncbi:DsbA family oxidoreductase [Brevundimonas goettingensis]|uniref:DsbA family oxidoreductase n=1 Tax=Brevundimonas goettingensis TaxID=2774190 RepID=A0A975GV89_9CAUL|nr:DsbA family oxidoreductase [Brevundimonas goettingensis]QTC90338.1 DsbA family oxidoreductase [Brevundimonas goettingensis]